MEKLNQLKEVYFLNHSLVTQNLNKGFKVYGETLIDFEGKEYRVWDPRRSKLAAAVLNGLKSLELNVDSKVLYLGASTGTTASHISDIISQGIIYCVEFSPRMMRELLRVCENRDNMMPLLEDATKPQKYLNLLEKVDVVYADVAQPQQSDLFIQNMRLIMKEDGQGLIMLKSRSIDVTKKPAKVFKEEEKKLKKSGFRVLEKIKLSPYEKDHLALLVEFSF